MHPSLLQNISQPRDLKRLNSAQIQQLCGEIRQFLLDSVSKTGGHLASNLGAVELTVALHRVFETPQDAFVFDVGHQCYTHKLLTGRYKRFGTLRQLDGLSGFPNPNESAHDAFIAGHGNTALSVAIGIAWAKKLKGEPGHVVAIIGDGAFTGGMVYEGMNNIGKAWTISWSSLTIIKCPFPIMLVRWQAILAICAPQAAILRPRKMSTAS